MNLKRQFSWKYLTFVLIFIIGYSTYQSTKNIEKLTNELRAERKTIEKLKKQNQSAAIKDDEARINPKILKSPPAEKKDERPVQHGPSESEKEVESGYEFGKVFKIPQKPYDHTRGTPSDPVLIERRDFVRNMMKHAWNGYREKAWGFNEVQPRSGTPSTSNIFGKAKTGATIIDGLDTLWIMGLEKEFEEGRRWVAESFNLRISNSMLSSFETVIRFLGGLLGAYHMSGDYLFAEKAKEVAELIDPAFNTPFPAAHFNPATGRHDGNNGRILAEVGSFHLEYYDLAYATGEKHWWDRAYGIRKLLHDVQKKDGLISNRLSCPRKAGSDSWTVSPSGSSYSYGAEGDSYYEYLIKSYVQTGLEDEQAKEMYFESLAGAKKHLLKNKDGHKFFQDYPGGVNTMQHLACFAGGMVAYGAKFAKNPAEDLEIGASVTTSCHLSYHNSPSHIGTERFTMLGGVGPGSPAYYILRPEEERFRDMAWEAAQAIEQYCKAEYGYAGLANAGSSRPTQDNLQRSFFLAETLKYLYLIFSEDDLISLDEFVFNTEAHPMIITR
ncbi:Oidioi.mRNA.OKI2018_I69.chr1.g330.t1.cds [Oikopleura dioica]|uniref:alpha-1,2-Mannosidase n=1 Tax=Oikopleura dioica TaxID=34765 RepID=A0ABN7SQS2_OIKDI|nr:Oidioi.mRNA.OKI2018_I69.chr1.g330.t1.cds [Oikopleura dioica]